MKRLKWLLPVLFIVLSLAGCQSDDDDEDTQDSPDTSAPTISDSSVNTSGINVTMLKLTWNEAADDTDKSSELTYTVYMSETDNLNDLDTIDDNGTELGNTENGTPEFLVDSLSRNTTYYFNIVVMDNSGNKSLYSSTSAKTRAESGLEFSGQYIDENYNTPVSNSTSLWNTGGSKFHVIETDIVNDYLIALNDSGNQWNPGKYSRFDWIADTSGDIYYCQSAYKEDTAEEARMFVPERDDPSANNSCGQFTWSKLVPYTDISGDFIDNNKIPHTISVTGWVIGENEYDISMLNSIDDYAIVSKPNPDDPFDDEIYSRFDWMIDASDDTYFCIAKSNITYYEASNLEGADLPDRNNPAVGGCNGSPWTLLTPLNEFGGEYVDNMFKPHIISATSWKWPYNGFSILSVDTSEDYLIALNDADNEENGELYSRFDWTMNSGDLYFCHTVKDADSSDDSDLNNAPDDTNLVNGCNSDPWRQLSAFDEIGGDYKDNYGGVHEISALHWINESFSFSILEIDVSNDFMVAQNNPDNSWFPNSFSRFNWVEDATGDLYYCQSVYNADSVDAARNAPDPTADTPAINGCGDWNFPWSELIPYNEEP